MQKRFSVLPRDIFLSGCYYYNKKAERGEHFPADDCAGAEWNATGKKVRSMSDKLEKDYWHPGFLGAMEIEFREFRSDLVFDDEHSLSKEPLRIDLLVIKKNRNVRIRNQIGDIFRQYNVIEYKSPDDGMTIDDYYKTIGYACLYKGLGKTVNEIPGEELTVTLIRDTHPGRLFEMIVESGGVVSVRHPGVYDINGIIGIPSQVIVTRELDQEMHSSLRVLTKQLRREDAECFIRLVKGLTEPGDRQNADAILQLSVSANREIYDRIRKEDPKMCEALKDLMKDEFVKAKEEGREEGRKKGREEGRILEAVVIYRDEMHMSDELITKAIMNKFSLSLEDAEAYVM